MKRPFLRRIADGRIYFRVLSIGNSINIGNMVNGFVLKARLLLSFKTILHLKKSNRGGICPANRK